MNPTPTYFNNIFLHSCYFLFNNYAVTKGILQPTTFHTKDQIKFIDKARLKIIIVGHWPAHKTINDKNKTTKMMQ